MGTLEHQKNTGTQALLWKTIHSYIQTKLPFTALQTFYVKP
jgi:hypothetical protein